MAMAFVVGVVLPMVIVWIAMLLAPLLTRREIFFSVTVPVSFRETVEAKAILRQYWMNVSLLFAALLGVGWLAWDHLGPTARPLWVLVALVGIYLAFFRGRRQALPHAVAPSMVREASLSSARASPFEGAGWELPPFLIPVLTGAYLIRHWSELPVRFPIHYDITGTPNGWADRTPMGVLGGLLIVFVVLVVLVVSRAATLRLPRASVTGPSAEQDLRLRRRVSRVQLALEYVLALGISRLTLIPLWPAPPVAMSLAVAGGTVGLIVLLALVVARSRRTSASAVGDGTDESHWKSGLFYVNPDDPALFVEKRFGFGWTLNFGRPSAWVFLLLPVLLVAVAVLVGTKH